MYKSDWCVKISELSAASHSVGHVKVIKQQTENFLIIFILSHYRLSDITVTQLNDLLEFCYTVQWNVMPEAQNITQTYSDTGPCAIHPCVVPH